MTPRVIECIFYPAGTHDDIYNRSYTAGLRNRDVVDKFMDTTNNGRNITTGNMSRIADEIITLTASVDQSQRVIIPNGFKESRLAFTMLVETDVLGDTIKYQLITGFTDREDISHGEHLAPDTMLFVNNCSSYRSVYQNGRTRIVTDDNSYILRGTENLLGGERRRDDVMHYIRPQDIYYHLSAPGLLNSLSPSGTVGKFDDIRSRTGSEYARTRRSYDSPASYLSQTVKAGLAGRRAYEDRPQSKDYDTADYNNYMSTMSSEDRAADILESQSTAHNDVFRRLLDASDFMRTGGVTMEQLEEAIDWRDAKIDVWSVGARRRTNEGSKHLDVSRRGEAREWHGADDNTMAAEMAVRIVPSLLMVNTIGCAVVDITNDTWDNSIQCHMSGVGPLMELLEVSNSQITAVEEQLRFDLGNVVSNNGAFRFSMHIDVSMYGSCYVKVWVDDASVVDEFTYPVYADCLGSAQVSRDPHAIEDIACDIEALLNAMDDEDSTKGSSIHLPDRLGNYN